MIKVWTEEYDDEPTPEEFEQAFEEFNPNDWNEPGDMGWPMGRVAGWVK